MCEPTNIRVLQLNDDIYLGFLFTKNLTSVQSVTHICINVFLLIYYLFYFKNLALALINDLILRWRCASH